MTSNTLQGLDGSNPLGFLAGLGALNALTERLAPAGTPRLSWRSGDWRAILEVPGEASNDSLLEVLREDLETWRQDPCLDLRYHKPKNAGKVGSPAWDLKPPEGKYRQYLLGLLADSSPRNRRVLDFAAAFATETARDNNGNTKPTALHFTAGQQEFLRMVADLVATVSKEDLREALFGPWRYDQERPVLGWDCTAARDYALRATDPSKDKRPGVPGADWLAFRGLSFIRVAPRGSQVLTTGCSGGWKTGRFRWPLWRAPLDRDTIQAVVQMPLTNIAEYARRLRGISAVFESAIRRSDQGGYGSFSPSAAV